MSAAGFLRKSYAIAWKDIHAELRGREMLNSMGIFALLVLLIFSFSFGPIFRNVDRFGSAALWVAFTFAGMLGLSKSFLNESVTGGLQGLMICPVDRSAIYVGKVLSNSILVFALEAFTLPMFVVFFDVSTVTLGLVPVLLLGTIGFVAVGTALSAVAVRTRARELFLPVLLFPLVVPVIMGGVSATRTLLGGGTIDDVMPWVKLLGAYDAILFTASIATFDYIVEG